MARDANRTLEVLEEISDDHRVTQRSLSQRLGISLGMANIYLKRLANKGYIKITTVPGKRLLRYMLTPQGFAAKTHLTYEFAKYSYRFLRSARQRMLGEFEQLGAKGMKRIVLCGTSELAEIAYLALREAGLELAAVAARTKGPHSGFLGHDVLSLDALKDVQFDAVIAFSEEDLQALRQLARQTYGGLVGEEGRVILLGPSAVAQPPSAVTDSFTGRAPVPPVVRR